MYRTSCFDNFAKSWALHRALIHDSARNDVSFVGELNSEASRSHSLLGTEVELYAVLVEDLLG
jgi:hypothetical protein